MLYAEMGPLRHRRAFDLQQPLWFWTSGEQDTTRSIRRSLAVVTAGACAALLAGMFGIVVALDIVLPGSGLAGAANGGAASVLRILLLADTLACLLVGGVLWRGRSQLVRLGSSLAVERERARAVRVTFEEQSEHVALVLGVAEQMVGVASTEDLAGIVTRAVREITGAEEVLLWLVGEDGSLMRAGTGSPPRPPALYLATSESGPAPAPGWALPLTNGAGDLLGVLEIRGRRRPPTVVASIVEALAGHAAGALEVQRRYTRLREASYTDPLTNLPNRWALDLALSRECEQAARSGVPLSVVMIDVDHFKRYNDLHGHAEGDRALVAISRVLARGLRRAGDGAFRYGGEEYVLVLPATDAASAVAVAERLRLAVRHAAESGDPRFPVTASFGVASTGPGRRVAADLLAAADAELYRAKRRGRDRVECCDAGDLGWRAG
jgi:diguanylate cyclase (GGDEF)-like protein